jgi:hypothetical protein
MSASLQRPVSVSVSGELMTNYLTGSSVDSSKPFSVVLDSSGEPLLLSLGASEEDATRLDLYALLRDNTVPTGWQRLTLSPVSGASVQVMQASQGPDGSIVLIAAVDDGAGGSRLFVSRPLPSDTRSEPWSNLSAQWVSRPGGPAGCPVQRVVVGDHRPEELAPMVVVEVKNGANTDRYFVDASPDKTDALWSAYHLPEDQKAVLDVAIGRMNMGVPRRGTYTLFQTTAGVLQVSFAPVGDTRYGQPPAPKTFAAPGNAQCLAVFPDESAAGCSVLFVGGAGVSTYDVAAQGKAKPVATALGGSASVSGIRQLLVRGQADQLRLWALTADQALYSLTGPLSLSSWSPPLSLRTNVAQIAALANRTRRSDELFAVSSATAPTIMHLWLDPSTSLWTEGDLPAPDSGSTQSFPCYTTVLRFVDAQGVPVANQPVQLSASQWVYATVNGYYKTLAGGTDNTVTVNTDAMGTVTVINKVSLLATPVFQVMADFLDAPVLADPSAALRERLAAQLSTLDLSEITLPDGTKLVPEGVDPDTLALVQEGVNQLLALTGSVPADGSPSDASTAPTPSAAKVSTPARVGRSPPTLQLGVVSNTLHKLDDAVDAVVCAAGDVIQTCINGIETVVGYTIRAVEKAWEFVVQVGEQVISFVIRTLSDILSALTWLFQEIGVLIDTLISWLGFLFNWDDILDTHKVLKNLAIQASAALGAGVSEAQGKVDGFLDELLTRFGQAREAVLASAGATSFNQAVKQTQTQSPPEVQSASTTLYSTPGGSFAFYQLQYGGVTGMSTPETGELSELVKDAFSAISTLLGEAYDALKTTWQDVMAVLQGDNPTVAELLEVLTVDVLSGLLTLAKQLIDDIFAVLDDIIAFVMGALNATVDIPLISGLYKLIAGGSELSVLDGFALLLAIPVTVLYKSITGEAPFANGTYGLDTLSWQQLQAALGQKPNSLQLAASRVEAGVEDDPGMKLYSVVGGLVALIADECNAILFPFATAAEKAGDERLAAVLCVLRAALNGLGLGGSVPFDNSTLEARIDRVMWALEGIETFTFGTLAGWECTRLANRDFWDPEAMEVAKGYSEVLGRVDAGMCVVIGLLGAGCDTYSFYLEAESTEDTLSNPVFAWYYEKLFSNYFGDIGMAAEGAVSFMKDPVVEVATEAVAVVFYPLSFLLDFSRLIAFAVGDLYYQTR